MIIGNPEGLKTPCTILVIDDERDVCEVTAEVVEHLGYRGVPLPSGMAALAYLVAGSHADAAIVDLCLPVMDGTQVVRALRQIKPSLAVLIVSGDLIADEKDLGSDVALLKKPFRIDEMDAALHRALGARAIRYALPQKAALAIAAS